MKEYLKYRYWIKVAQEQTLEEPRKIHNYQLTQIIK